MGELVGASYVVRGQLATRDAVRTLQVSLFDAKRAQLLWSMQRPLEEGVTHEALGALAQDIVANLDAYVDTAEQSFVINRSVAELDIDEMVWRARWHLSRLTREDAAIADDLLGRSMQAKPNSAEVLIQSALARAWSIWSRREQAASIEVMRALALRAVAADAFDARGYMLTGMAEMWLRNHARAQSLFDDAIRLNPSLASAYAQSGSNHYLGGQPAEALSPLKTALRLSPLDNPGVLHPRRNGDLELHARRIRAGARLHRAVARAAPRLLLRARDPHQLPRRGGQAARSEARARRADAGAAQVRRVRIGVGCRSPTAAGSTSSKAASPKRESRQPNAIRTVSGYSMLKLKWFDTIASAQRADRAAPPHPLPLFDFQSLALKSRSGQWFSRFVFRRVMPAVFALLRTFWPNPRLGRLIIVTREADVRAVLDDNVTFPNVYSPEMTELGGDQNSVLGMEGKDHQELREELHNQIKKEDLEEIARLTRDHATALIEASDGRIDVMRDFVTRCATEVCCTYLGVTPNDPDTFAEWTMAVSAMLFGDPFGDPNTRLQGTIGAAHLRATFDDAIARVVANNASHPDTTRDHRTLTDRFITVSGMTPALARASLIGLATALIPTNTLACGNLLEQLLGDPTLMAEATEAARKGKKDLLENALLKAVRLNPALSPGQWRTVARDGVIAKGRWRARKVRKDDIVLVAVASALRDGRVAPEVRNDPRRAAWLMFGDGPHACLGAQVAMTQLVEMFAVLLRLEGLTPVPDADGSMFRTGPFPTRLDMTFDDPSAGQSMITIASPVLDGTGVAVLTAQIELLGNPARDDVAKNLNDCGLVHFTSLSAIEAGPGSDRAILLFEINADGGQDRAIAAVAKAGFDWLAPIFAHCVTGGEAPTKPEALADILRTGAQDLHTWPWGATGLNFNGTAEFSVADIERQERLTAFAREALAHFFASNLGSTTRAMDALVHVRRFLKQDSFYALRGSAWRRLFEEAGPLQYAIIRPSRKRLQIADWVAPKSSWSPLWTMVKAPPFRPFLVGLATLFFAIAASILWNQWASIPRTMLGWFWTVTGAAAGSLATILLGGVILLGVLIGVLRWHEDNDPIDDRAPELARIKEIARLEDAPGYEQNHIIAVMPFKPGPFRRLVFAFAMWGIQQSVTYWFRPGFVVTMGTIHKAKWFRVRGTDQFVFLSNYDGSWESYLEDFVTRAHQGQSAAWSNGVDFPRTRFLLLDGAADGDRFKRWVRRQQRPTAFWFSRYPHLTTKQIRNNAMIEDGLARAANDTDARRWLTCFGSAQREDGEIEAQEVQSIVFTGFGRQLFSTSMFIKLPGQPDALRAWLQAVSGITFSASPGLIGLPPRWKVANERPPDKEEVGLLAQTDAPQRYRLPPEAQIVFGDRPVDVGGLTLGLTSYGLQRCGVDHGSGLEAFPPAFQIGMAGRDRLLNDGGSGEWPWNDGGLPERSVDAVITIYGNEPPLAADPHESDQARHDRLVGNHSLLLRVMGGQLVETVPCTPVPGSGGGGASRREHFGFRDGISQPVIRGTQRSGAKPALRDLIAAGEFPARLPQRPRLLLTSHHGRRGAGRPQLTADGDGDRRQPLPEIRRSVVGGGAARPRPQRQLHGDPPTRSRRRRLRRRRGTARGRLGEEIPRPRSLHWREGRRGVGCRQDYRPMAGRLAARRQSDRAGATGRRRHPGERLHLWHGRSPGTAMPARRAHPADQPA